MDPSQNPLSELDLFCDWSGDPNDTVEVRMAIEVWCTPNTTVPILNTGFPIVRVKSSSIRPSVGKPDLSWERHRHRFESWTQSPQTPERKPMSTLKEHSSPLHSTDQSSPPGSESVIVRSDARSNDSPGKTTLGDSSRSSILGQGPFTPNSRKRNAKAASLPDSVTDSERGYGGTKHKAKHLDNDPQSPVISLRHSTKPSLIPRPVSSLNHQTEPARVPLPTDSAPVSVADFERFEEPPLIQKENLHQGSVDESLDASQLLVADTDVSDDDSSDLALTRQGNREADLEKLSTVASPGTPLGNESSPNASSSSIGSPAEEVFIMPSSPPVSAPANPDHPCIVTIDRQYSVLTPANATAGQYSVTFTFLLCLHRGQPKGWWNVTFPDLPRLQNNENGYVYFWIPADQGIEIRTSQMKRHSINQACMMGQFPLPYRFILPLRVCDGLFYGFLKDFKVTYTIRSEVVDDDDLQTCHVKYIAVCSIDLIGRDFWSEKCGFTLYIHGGPQGSFTCNLLAPQDRLPGPQDPLQMIHLESGHNKRPGVSALQVISPRENLAALALSWEVFLPRKRLVTWTPHIKSSPEIDDEENLLRVLYEGARLEVTTVDPLERLERKSRRRRRTRFKRVWYSRRWRRAFSIVFLLLLFRLLYRVHEAWCPYGHAMVGVVEVEVPFQVEDVPPVEGVTATEHAIEVEDAAEESLPTAEQGSTEIDITELASQVEDLSQDDDTPNIEPAVPSQPMTEPLLSFRDRIDYLLGWRGPLQDL